MAIYPNKTGKANMGNPCSEETKIKIAASKIGKPRSDETKARMSAAAKNRGKK